MAKKPIEVETLTYDATRKNIPTEEYESIMREQDKTPIQLAYERRNRDLDPQLVWRGKDEQDWSDLIVQAPPLTIQEKVHPKVIFDDLKRESAIHSYLTYLRDRLAYSHRQPCKRPYPRSESPRVCRRPST